MQELNDSQRKKIIKQFNKDIRKVFDRWHERTLKKVEKILGIKNE